MKKRTIYLVLGMFLAAVAVACGMFWILAFHPDWFGGDSLYKPLSDCPLPAPTVPADAGWSPVVPDSSWEGWQPDDPFQKLDAVAVDSRGQVYVAGNFSQIGGLKTGGIARWDPESQQWYGLAGGLIARSEMISNLRLLVDEQDRVYASGTFFFAGGRVTNGIARWDGQEWFTFDGGLSNGQVNGMALDDRGGLYIVGSFTQLRTLQSAQIAHWNGAAWENPGGMVEKLTERLGMQPESISGIAYDPTRRTLYISGLYNRSNSHYFIAAWQEEFQVWNLLGESIYGGFTQLVISPKGGLYAAGSGAFVAGSSGVAVYAQDRWQGLGGGLTLMGGSKLEVSYHGTTNVPEVYTSSLAIDPSGEVYIGGHFTAVDDRCMHGVAHWTGREWAALGSGVLAEATFGPLQVKSIAFDPQGNLLVAGGFQAAGGKPIRYLARWTP